MSYFDLLRIPVLKFLSHIRQDLIIRVRYREIAFIGMRQDHVEGLSACDAISHCVPFVANPGKGQIYF